MNSSLRPIAPADIAWPRCKLKDLVDDRGITYGVVQPGQPWSNGTPIVRVSNITPAGLRLDDVLNIDPAIAAKYGRSQLHGGEVLVTLVGSVGQVAVVPPQLAGWNIARAVAVVPVRREISPQWVAWCLRSIEADRFLQARLNTTVQSTLNLRDLAELAIPMPPVTVIQAIASILGALDNKIDSNRRLAALIEQVVTTLFQGRFMEPFPLDSDDGNQPAEWAEAAIGDLASAYREPIKAASGLPYIGLNEMPPGSTILSEWLTDGAPEGQANRFVRGDILFGKLRPYFQKVGVAPIDGRCSKEILVIRPGDERYWGFVFGHIASQAFIDHCVAVSRGTRMPRAEWKDAGSFSVRVPPPGVAGEHTQIVRDLYARIHSLMLESRTLTAARDALLPKLVSGKIRVPSTADPDAAIEQVTA